MKLIGCLVTFVLVFVIVSPGLTTLPVGEERGCSIALEQLQKGHSSEPDGWVWDLWAEWIWSSRRPGRWWRKFYRLLRRLMRQHHRRVQHWQRLRQEWWALMAGAPPGGLSIEEAQAPAYEPDTSYPPAPLGVEPTPLGVGPGAEASSEPTAFPRRRAGRPRTVPTDQVCCPHEACRSYGILGPHPKHDIVGCGTYTTLHGERRQMYRCKVCGQPFSETAGTVFFGLKTPCRTVCIALQELAEGLGIRAVARIHGVDPNTVLDWLRKAGQHCERLSEYLMQELELSQVQLDELWTFVRKKERMLSEWEKLQSEYGDTWIWVAFDPVHKLVIAVLVGDHTEEEAVGLLAHLRARLAQSCLPWLTSDSLPHYVQAILRVFGVWVQPLRRGKRGPHPKPHQVPPEDLRYATVHKHRKQGRVVSVTTKVIYGRKKEFLACLESLGQTINTSFVERMNLTLRHLLSRLHRKTLCFSKKREYLVCHLHLGLAYYHLVRYHSSLRVRLSEPLPTRGSGSPKKWDQRTPAMAAGLTDHAWSMAELLRFHVPARAE